MDSHAARFYPRRAMATGLHTAVWATCENQPGTSRAAPVYGKGQERCALTFFLDTNICIYVLKGKFPGIQRRLLALPPAQLAVPAMVEAELRLGAAKSQTAAKTMKVVRAFLAPLAIVPFDSAAAVHYATIRGALEVKGKPIGPNDYVIAATVMAHGGILVTANDDEFSRVPGLRIENWATSD